MNKVYISQYINSIDEIYEISGMWYKMGEEEEKKDVRIEFPCKESTRKKFKLFVVNQGFKNMEDALLYLLNKVSVKQVPIRTYSGEEKTVKKKEV